jgi:hypothetical protein
MNVPCIGMCEEKQRLLQEFDKAIAALKQSGPPADRILEIRVKKAGEALNRHIAEHRC